MLIKIPNERHATGNLIRSGICDNHPDIFVAYRVPHPLAKDVLLEVESPEGIGMLTDVCESLARTFDALLKDLDHLS